MRKLLTPILALAFAAACSPGQPSFTVTSASTDSTHWCPGNSQDAAYPVHTNVHLHNGTSSQVTISAVTAVMKLEAIQGNWLEKVGDKYEAGSAEFAPTTVAANSDADLKVTFHSSCTSPAYGASGSSYGEYRITLHLQTSAGSYSISSGNRHRILTA